MNNPKVSILIPAYNPGSELIEAINSAINQIYKNIEILVIDDGSNNKFYLNESKKKFEFYDNIIFLELKNNQGVSSALNFGIDNSKGEYISWLSHDDLFSKYKIKKQINFLSKNIEAKIVSSNAIVFNRKIKYFKKFNLKKDMFTFSDLFYNDKVNGCSILLDKKIFSEYRFDVNLRYTQDYDLWLRISKKYKIYHLNKYLIYSRRHLSQDTITHNKEVLQEIENLSLNYLNNFIFENYYFKNQKKIFVSIYFFSYRGKIKTVNKIIRNFFSVNDKNLFLNLIYSFVFLTITTFGLFLNKIRFIYNNLINLRIHNYESYQNK